MHTPLKNEETAQGRPTFSWGLFSVLNSSSGSLVSTDSERWSEKFTQYIFWYTINHTQLPAGHFHHYRKEIQESFLTENELATFPPQESRQAKLLLGKPCLHLYNSGLVPKEKNTDTLPPPRGTGLLIRYSIHISRSCSRLPLPGRARAFQSGSAFTMTLMTSQCTVGGKLVSGSLLKHTGYLDSCWEKGYILILLKSL